jgi:hypothetical protein
MPFVIPLENFEVHSIGGAPPIPAGTVKRAEIDPLFAGAVVGAAVCPLYSLEVKLAVGPERLPDGQVRYAVEVPPAPRAVLLEHGQLILEEVRSALRRNATPRLRKLCWWFPFVLRMPEVKAFLDGLPRQRAEQIARGRRGRGRPADPGEEFGRVATMTALWRERNISIAEAAAILAKDVPALNVVSKTLESLHAELADLVRCLDGYEIPASELSPRHWGEDGNAELPVYVSGSRGGADERHR